MSTIVLAIDPGYEQSAWIRLTDQQILDFGIAPNPEFIHELETKVAHHAVIEQVQGYGMAVGKEVFETVWWSGRFHDRLLSTAAQLHRLPRRDVKLHLCGQARAKDVNIRRALIDRYGPEERVARGTKANPGPLYGVSKDVWAALALGVTFLDTVLKAEAAA